MGIFGRSQETDAALDKAKAAVKHMLVGASMAGAAGAATGGFLALVRNESVKFYSASMGANFFLLSSTYIAFEEIIADKRAKKDWITGSAAGAITGGFYAGLFGGHVRELQGAAAGAAVGAAVILGREEFHKWRLAKALERYEEKYGEAPAVYYPNSDVLVESKGPARELAFPSLLPKTIKVSEEEVERRVLARMEELRKEMEEEEAKQHAEEEEARTSAE